MSMILKRKLDCAILITMKVERIVGNVFESNVFVCPNEHECFLIDAGAKPELLRGAIGDKKVLAVLLTHGHYDHVFYAREYAKEFECKIFACKEIAEYIEDPFHNASEGHFEFHDFSNFEFFDDDATLNLGDFEIQTIKLGGHTKSDVAYLCDGELFVGDVFIGRDIGKINLYGGDKSWMIKSLEKLLEIKYENMHSGHGQDNKKNVQDFAIKIWLKFLNRN